MHPQKKKKKVSKEIPKVSIVEEVCSEDDEVSEQIKELAERSRDATKEIEKLIKGMQIEVSSVISASKEGYNEVTEGTKMSEISANKITEIISQVDKTVSEIENVNTSVQEQYLAIEEITKAIGSVAEGSSNVEVLSVEQLESAKQISEKIKGIVGVTLQTTAQTEEMLAASDELAEIASSLSELVGVFKTATTSKETTGTKLRE